MITNINIRGFKSLQKVDLSLRHLNLFIGTNASGKSSFFDALRVLQGIGYGFTINEILNGKPQGANSDVWEHIRGGISKAAFITKGVDDKDSRKGIVFNIRMLLPSVSGSEPISYSIGLSAPDGWVILERLSIGTVEVFSNLKIDTNALVDPFVTVRYYSRGQGRPRHLRFEKSRPVLHQLLRAPACTEGHGSVNRGMHMHTLIGQYAKDRSVPHDSP